MKNFTVEQAKGLENSGYSPPNQGDASISALDPRRPLQFSDLPSYPTVLLLQGPLGPFFSKLSKHLQSRGSAVWKVNFNPGDDLFYPPNNQQVVQYRHRPEFWDKFAHNLLLEQKIKAVFLFGDCRPMHQSIKPLCQAYGIDLWVLEEGYYRPHFFTLEKGGANHYSPITRLTMEEIMAKHRVANEPTYPSESHKNSYWHMVQYGISYWFINLLINKSYSNYLHHRNLDLKRAYGWTKSFYRYWSYRLAESSIKKKIFKKNVVVSNSGHQFLVPLQVFDDSQISTHSDYDSVSDFLEEVITSFSNHLHRTKSADVLIIKHHPMDRGHVNYRDAISQLGSMFNISQHLVYIHDIRLPSLFPVVDGCITINSTFGLQALSHGVPTIVLGRSHYDKPGLTSQCELDEFWLKRSPVDRKAVQTFKSFVICSSQVNGSLYSPNYQIR